MSVIVWDGKTLAADKRACNGSLIRTTTKIFKVRGCLVGYTGGSCFGEQVLDWFKEGAQPEKYPESQRDKDDWSGLLVIRPSKEINMYERTPYPIKYEDEIFACGSGRDFALGAMFCGKTAAEAVAIACQLDNGCGNGIDTLEFD